jgi:MFS family permease
MIPAMAIISSSAQPKLRGTFMSLNGTVQSLAMGLATTLAGFVTSLDDSGRIVGYPLVGYVGCPTCWRSGSPPASSCTGGWHAGSRTVRN